ncbi:Spy0128 family protein [Butyrivibrio sp. YAB3001]|uniref:Spy0128 family protein n=1 Tax=Butyrivibrio sp. YAB3001 TaxID=1520812 RepID=UPI0008F65B0F|nr:Cna B-type domain-containing protein [Butyrivibrio sp. YAB3001]SFC43361.1 LPXTG-motif cell wall anchor domain-containing protein [Butyrivibrio sp. YAB3001]
MRKTDQNRAENYIKKHRNNRRWLAFALCVSIFTGTVTLYMLNKPATAMTEDGAKQVGLVLETADDEFEQGLIEQMNKSAAENEEEKEISESAEQAEESASEGSETSESNDNATSESGEDKEDSSKGTDESIDDSSKEASDDAANEQLSDEDNASDEKTSESDKKSDNADKDKSSDDEKADNESSKEDEAKDEADSEDTSEDKDSKKSSKDKKSKDGKSKDTKTDEEKIKEEKSEEKDSDKKEKELSSEDIELLEDVVLTVSYVDEDGNSIADEKEISLSDSLDFESEAPKLDEYTFKQATIDETIIQVITVKRDEEEHRYYEVTLEDGSVVSIKENKTVVLTYTSDSKEESAEEEKDKKEVSSVKLTARYVDKNGEEISEASELNVLEELSISKDTAENIDGYFYTGAVYDEKNVTKITPIFMDEEELAAESDDSKDGESSDKKSKTENGDQYASGKEATNEDRKTADTEKTGDEAVDTSEGNDAKAGNEALPENETQETTDQLVGGYIFTTEDGQELETREDAEISFTYIKASEETEFVYSDDKVTVTAVTNEKGLFPEGIEFKVTEITSESTNYNYDAYLNALNDNAQMIADEAGLEGTNEYDDSNTLMFDIAFMYEGKEIQPSEGKVSISIEFKDNQLTTDLAASAEEEITVLHLPIKEEVKESNEISSTEEATEITADDIEVKPLNDASAAVENEEKVEFSSESFSVYAVTVYQKHDAGTDTFKTVLGDAVNFGMVADNLYIGESETNFAVKNAYTTSHSGNDLTNPAEQTFIAGRLEGNFQIKGYPAYFMIPAEYTKQITHASGDWYLKFDTAYSTYELDSLVEDMMVYVREASRDLASRKATAKIVYDTKSQKYNLDIRSYGPGTYYVSLDDVEMGNIARTNTADNSDKLHIYKNSDQVIVFNVTASPTVKIQKFSVSTDSGELLGSDTMAGSNQYSAVSRTIIWNFINATEVESAGGVVGVFISGQKNAKWVNYSTCGGWVAFPTVEIESGEWHNTYTEVTQISGTAQFQAYKNIDGEFATASGFKFTLYKKDWSAQDGWKEIQTVSNSADTPHNIVFTPITYGGEKGNDKSNYQYTSIGYEGASETFVYKIVESSGATDSQGNAYTADKTVYYAKVTVTMKKMNEVTKHMYYQVSAPEYFTDEACTKKYYSKDGDIIPTFNNTTTKGSVGISLHKFLNNGDPGDFKFTFTVKVVDAKNNRLETLTDSLTNVGEDISFSFNYNNNYIYNDSVYFVINENDIKNDDSSGIKITKDDSYIVVRVVYIGTPNQVAYYYRLKPTDEEIEVRATGKKGTADIPRYIWGITKQSKYAMDSSKAGFYNTGTGWLRIHKMVVNDFGSGFVRNNTGTALLSNVKFRLTNNATQNYIVVKGFTGKAGDVGQEKAKEYDANTHAPTGREFSVVYNQSAQWTILDLPVGEYTVDEVADGLTFSYSEENNLSTVIEETNLSRVTKYDVTWDEEVQGAWEYGTGGGNRRMVFSVDLANHSVKAPSNVKVGGAVATVQVCNYYSIPIGPIQVTKNFSGGVWDENLSFTFKLEPIAYYAKDSEDNPVTLKTQPMPYGSDTAIVTAADAKRNENGSYTAIAKFESIPYRFKGNYYYKITEVATGIDGITYDESVYYLRVDVEEKYTKFEKTYTEDNLTKYAKYTKTTTLLEDFYYLGAKVTYSDDEDFNNVLAECNLELTGKPDTSKKYDNHFTVTYTKGSVDKVAFNNTLSGKVTVNKVWLDSDGNIDSAEHSPLTLIIWQRVNNGPWHAYGNIQLSKNNNWTFVKEGLPITDEHGNLYEYTVKEPDSYVKTYHVTYAVNGGQPIDGNSQGKITVDNESNIDTGYVLGIDSTGKSYGVVTITNRAVCTNVIPSTGGSGTAPFTTAGIIITVFAAIGFLFTRRKKMML